MSMIRIFIFLFFILITQEVVSQQLSLDSAILIALRNNPGLMISKNNMDIARLSNSFGMAGGLPQVLVNSSVTQAMTSLEQRFSNPLNNKNSNNANSNNINAGLAANVP
ncbi:MAG TPA: hypothetical protein DIC22_04065, partial [Chitinophagaceae bacterium]|nr:hypothetical protein [Chitinophagaceae bacterium]